MRELNSILKKKKVRLANDITFMRLHKQTRLLSEGFFFHFADIYVIHILLIKNNENTKTITKHIQNYAVTGIVVHLFDSIFFLTNL